MPLDITVSPAPSADAQDGRARNGDRMNAAVELVGVDWGTSNLRVMRIADGGELLEMRSDPRGAAELSSDRFSGVLREVAGDWLGDGAPVLVCGMAGARGKWREAGYRDCPAGLADLAPLRLTGEHGDVSIVPGMALSQQGALVDVMRGEETQVMGFADRMVSGLVVTPGTHSKWIRIDNGAVRDFRTFMTGDLFSAIRAGTLLGHEMGDPGGDLAAFQDGVTRALEDDALTAALFSVRIEQLSDRLSTVSTADYLSGLLIGAEIQAQGAPVGRSITLVGAPLLNDRYTMALDLAGFEDVRTLDGPTATARGLWRIHRAHRS